jgi:hypothetical protein
MEKYVDTYFNKHLKTLKSAGLVYEWIRLLIAKADAVLLANHFLECMRNETNGTLRIACAAFASLMESMTFPEISELLSQHVSQKNRSILKDPYASEFYLRFRACVILQVKNYWHQFLESQKDKPPVETPEVPFKKHEISISEEQKSELSEIIKKSMQDGTEEVIKKIRRDVDGEGWKDGEIKE